MKKLILFVLTITLLLTLPSCGCKHEWSEATCVAPKTCSLCGKTEGPVSSVHTWKDATCIAPKTCARCGITEGKKASTHSYVGDKCENCGIIQLTPYNYDDYIDCNVTVKVDDIFYDYKNYDVITTIECNFEATGNTHYRYNNVSIEVKFNYYDFEGFGLYLSNSIAALEGTPITEEAVPVDSRTRTINLNLAGNGSSSSCILYTDWAENPSRCKSSSSVFNRTTYEIVSISGTVQEY